MIRATLFLLFGACTESDDAPFDAAGGIDASADAGTPADSGTNDAGALDAGALDADVGADVGDGLLAIAGTCGELDTELTDDAPHFVQNTSVFPEGFSRDEAARVSEGAQTILDEGTAGGSSGYSEAFAFEVLHRCEGAELVRTETMIRYTVPMPGAITDILVSIGGEKIGVSVTRAVTVTGMCMRADTFDAAAASELIERKLAGINESSMLVSTEDAWVKQILFVYADTEVHAAAVRTAWETADAALRADTILYVSVSEEMDGFVYFEDRCP
jgi:hypothetical protein